MATSPLGGESKTESGDGGEGASCGRIWPHGPVQELPDDQLCVDRGRHVCRADPRVPHSCTCTKCGAVFGDEASLLGWCDTHQTHHLARETRILPADVDGVPVHVEERIDHRTNSRTVMVGGGFMVLDDEPVITPYERAGHVCTLDCPNPWREGSLSHAIRALLHDGIPRGVSNVAAELGSTPWGAPGYFYEDVVRQCANEVQDGRIVATPTEGEGENMLTLPEED
jgi:hypothetical protein